MHGLYDGQKKTNRCAGNETDSHNRIVIMIHAAVLTCGEALYSCLRHGEVLPN